MCQSTYLMIDDESGSRVLFYETCCKRIDEMISEFAMLSKDDGATKLRRMSTIHTLDFEKCG